MALSSRRTRISGKEPINVALFWIDPSTNQRKGKGKGKAVLSGGIWEKDRDLMYQLEKEGLPNTGKQYTVLASLLGTNIRNRAVDETGAKPFARLQHGRAGARDI